MGKGSQQAEQQASRPAADAVDARGGEGRGRRADDGRRRGHDGRRFAAGAGGNSGQKTGQADVKSIAEALRRELVEATADALGENVPIEDIRRKTEQGRSTLGFSKVDAPATFDRSRAAAPPPVPEARRPLLYNYFIRKK